MKIGISSACFYPVVNTEDSIKLMKKLGFEFGELFINAPSEYEENFLEILKEEKQKYKFDIISLHAFSTFFEVYLFDLHKKRRKDMIKYFKTHCKFANVLGAKYYTFHGIRYEKLTNERLKFLKEIYEELSYTALENGIKLAQENVCWCQSKEIDFLSFLKEEVKSPIYFTLDIKQAYRAKISLNQYLKVMGDRLVNVHINDHKGEETCLLPGKGNVDYDKLFKSLQKQGYCGRTIIEVYRNNYKTYNELLQAKKFLERV